MKKILTLSLLMIAMSASVFAEQAPQSQAENQEPVLYLSVFDTSASSPRDLKTQKLSRTNKNLQLCWLARGTFKQMADVVEQFSSPAKMTFKVNSGEGLVTSSKDKRSHTITMKRPSVSDSSVVSACWRFDNSDPIGKYSLQVKVDDIQYTPLNFEVVK